MDLHLLQEKKIHRSRLKVSSASLVAKCLINSLQSANRVPTRNSTERQEPTIWKELSHVEAYLVCKTKYSITAYHSIKRTENWYGQSQGSLQILTSPSSPRSLSNRTSSPTMEWNQSLKQSTPSHQPTTTTVIWNLVLSAKMQSLRWLVQALRVECHFQAVVVIPARFQ